MSLKSQTFNFVIPETAVRREKLPFILANQWKPDVIWRATLKVIQVAVCLNLISRQHLKYRFTIA